MLLHAGSTNRESKALGSRNLTGTRQRMSLPLLAHLTGGIPPAEFSWIRAATLRERLSSKSSLLKSQQYSELQNGAITCEAILTTLKCSFMSESSQQAQEIPPCSKERRTQQSDGTCIYNQTGTSSQKQLDSSSEPAHRRTLWGAWNR